MAIIRRNILAITKDLYANEWLFRLVEGMAQEQDAGRLVFIAQATGKRVTRAEDGKFVGLDGSAITEADLIVAPVPVLVQARRLELVVAFAGDDSPVKVNDLKATSTGPQFAKIKAALKGLAATAMEEKVADIDDGEVVNDEDSPLDKM